MKQTPRPTVAAVAWFVAASWCTTAASLPAQCTNPWPTVPGSTGVEGAVSDMLAFDPDGAGPIGERVLVAGNFRVAGSVFAQNLAVYDPATRTWSAFGPGPYPINLHLARDGNGDLYVGGTFTTIAGVAANNVAKWDGTNWSPLGAGVVGSVFGMAALPTGGVLLTGDLTSAGGSPTVDIARWDGATWSSLGSVGLAAGGFLSLRDAVPMANGDVCAAVQLNTTTSNFVGVMRFDGTSWTPLGASMGATPFVLRTLPNGDLLAGGQSTPGGGPGVARWDGTTWSVLGTAPFAFVNELDLLPNGTLVAGGNVGSSTIGRVASWDGFTWTQLGDSGFGNLGFTALAALASGDLLVGGSFWSFGGVSTRGVARWNGSTWLPSSPGLAVIRALAVRPDGSVFASIGGGQLGDSLVYRWNGASWTPIGGGVQGYDTSNLTCLYAAPSGSLVTGGQSGWGSTVPIVQRWSGSIWSTLGTAASGTVSAAVELPNGDLVVGGQLASISGVTVANVARFDGTTWSPLGNGLSQAVVALTVSPAGDLFAMTGTSVFRWNGSAWVQFGLSQSGLRAFAIGADGVPVVAGSLSGPDVLRWNGSFWAPLGSGPAGPVQSLAILPNGDLAVGPLVDTSNPARPIERWNGSAWVPLGSAVDATVLTMANALNGDLLLGGTFTAANGVARGGFARVSTSCPAAIQSLQAGCQPFFAPVLAATSLAWLGGVCRTSTTNLSTSSLAVVATGVQPAATLLSTLLPQVTSACTLLVTPDVLGFALPVAGRIDTQFPVPNVASLLGASVRQQVLPIFLDANGAITDVRASNALVFQLGSF